MGVKKYRALVPAAALTIALPALGAVAHHPPASREAAFAAQSVVYDLVLLTSPSVHQARQHCRGHCGDEGGDIEMAIGLLGIGGHVTTQSLLNLLSVQLDGGGAEERECQIAKRGKALVPALKQLNPVRVSNWCHQTFHDLRKRELADVNDVSVELVCRPPSEVDTDRKEWIAALQSGRDLFAESGPC
jgi:hypothetical protein